MLDDLADLLLGARCPGCERPGLGVCERCRAELRGGAWRVADALALDGLEVFCSAQYGGAVRELLSAHKDRGALSLAGLLGGRLAVALDALLDQPGAAGERVVLVPVPSSPSAVRRRGYDHSAALARAARRRLGPELGARVVGVRPVLSRRGGVLDQSGLGRAERLRNQHGTVRARPPVSAVRLAVLTDDICTTGASLAEAARALRAAGWQVLGAAVVAHPSRPGSRGLAQSSVRSLQIRSGQR